DDATKVGRLFNEMASGAGAYRQQVERLRRNGSIVSEQDLALSKTYKEATTDLSQSMKGLRMAVFRAFAPSMTAWVRLASNALNYYRTSVVEALIRSYNRFIILLRDVLKVMFGVQTRYAVQNTWLYAVKRGADGTIRVIKALIPVGLDLL